MTDNADLILMREGLSILREKMVGVLAALAGSRGNGARSRRLGYTHLQPAQLTTVGKRATLWMQDLVLDLADLDAPHGRVAVTWREGHDGNAGVIPRAVSRRSTPTCGRSNSSSARPWASPGAPGDGPDVFTEDRRAGAWRRGRHRDVGGQVQQRHPHAPVVRGTERTVRSRADRLVGDGLQAQSHALGADRVAGALRCARSSPMRTRRTRCSISSARSTTAPTGDSSIPEAFLATDAILLLMENVASGLEVHQARIRHRLMDELPFMATEQLIVRAVEAGADRQVIHEIIRRHSVEAASAMKNNGSSNDLLERLAGDREFPRGVDLSAAADPRRFVGRAPEQVDEFLAEVVEPLISSAPPRRDTGRRFAYEHGRLHGTARCTLWRRGKVRDVYEVDAERLLLVATDRVSAFDVVMGETVPHKGAVLTQISAWWLRQLGDRLPHHMLSATSTRSWQRAGARRLARHACGPGNAVPPHGSLSRRVCGARLHRRVGVEGVQRIGNARR